MRLLIPEHLQEHFKAGRHYLVATGKQAFLAESSAVFQRKGGGRPGRVLVVDLRKAWREFVRAIGDRREFTLADMVTMSRTDSTIIRLWELAGFLHPVDGSFDVEDAYTAGLCGMLRRRGLPVPVVHKAGVFVRTGAGLGVRR
jgi:hypothetical protein